MKKIQVMLLLVSLLENFSTTKSFAVNVATRYTKFEVDIEMAGSLFAVLLIILLGGLFTRERMCRKKLEMKLEHVKSVSEAKTTFISRISHDMRTPMNGILGLAELSKDTEDADVLKDNINRMQETGQYLLSLINDTLDFQKIERNQMSLSRDTVTLQNLLDGILHLVRPQADQKQIDIVVDNKNISMDSYVEVDALRTKQIFVNIISNAIKFSNVGERVVLKISYTGCEGMLYHGEISIIDNGVGMSKDFLENSIFKPFSQENNSKTIQGTGLGLAISKKLIEQMGGRIKVDSSLGSGTTFCVCMNFKVIEKSVAMAKMDDKQRQQVESYHALQNKKILLVEDHSLNAEIVTRLLEKVGCVVTWKENGQEGVDSYLKEPVQTYDAILMDIRMPVLDGLEATRKIRKSHKIDALSVPVIAMTANAYDEDIKACLEAGMNNHISKPIVPAEMYNKIIDCLEPTSTQ